MPSRISIFEVKAVRLAKLGGILAATSLWVSAADWPQYRGPNHDGRSTESVSKWGEAGPKEVWKTSLTDGFSSLTVADGKAFTLVSREVDGIKREVCVALDAKTGKELWAATLSVAKYDGGGDSGTPDNKGGDGPRSTPSISDGHVYVMDAKLSLSCLKASDGTVVWAHDLMKDYAGRNITWQNAASPLIDGDLVFVAGGGPGQSLLAFHKKDGKLAWKVEDEKMTHATPVAATILGTRQIIFFTQSGLVSVAPKDGSVVWRHPFKYNVSTAASPTVGGDIVYCTAGYDVGATAVRIEKDGGKLKATELWRKTGNKPVANHWSTPVYKDGYLFGMFSFKEYGKGPFKCVELATGKEVWSKEGFGAGNVTLAGNYLVALADNGQLVLIEPSAAGYNEVARAQVVAGKCWSTPSISGGKVFVRSTKEGVCLDLSRKMAAK